MHGQPLPQKQNLLAVAVRYGVTYRWLVSRRHGLFYRGINRVDAKLLRVNATLGEHNLLIQRREGGFSFRQIGFVRARVNAEQQIALFHRLVVADRQFYNATADFLHHINGIC